MGSGVKSSPSFSVRLRCREWRKLCTWGDAGGPDLIKCSLSGVLVVGLTAKALHSVAIPSTLSAFVGSCMRASDGLDTVDVGDISGLGIDETPDTLGGAGGAALASK